MAKYYQVVALRGKQIIAVCQMEETADQAFAHALRLAFGIAPRPACVPPETLITHYGVRELSRGLDQEVLN